MSDTDRPLPLEETPLGQTQREATQPKITTFYSLRTRNYLWFWIAALFSFAGLQMNIVARGWLVWEMTRSTVAIGVVSFAFGVPLLLFSIFGGAVVDRLPKRKLLQATQAFQAAMTLVIAILVSIGAVQFWHLVALSVGTGIFFVFDFPTRSAIIPELVGRRELLNAIALNSSGMNLTRVLAPTLAGALLVIIGMGGVFYIVTGCYIVALAALSMVSLARRPATGAEVLAFDPPQANTNSKNRSAAFVRSVLTDSREGLRYIRGTPLLVSLLALAFIPLAFGLPYLNLLPTFADEVLHVGEFGFGMLIAASGAGALIASLAIASLGDFRRKGILLLLLALAFGISLVGFAMSRSYGVSLAILVAVGAASTGYMTLNSTLIQSHVPQRMMGRVMSIYIMTFALMPLGTLPIGALAQSIGLATAVEAGAVVVIIFILAMLLLRPSLRRLE